MDPAQQNTKAPGEDCVGPTACHCVVGLAAHPARIPASNAQRARTRHRAGPRVGQSRAGSASRANSSRRTVGTPVRRATPRRALERTRSPARCQPDTQSTHCRKACLTTPRRQGLRPTLPGQRSVQLTSCRTLLAGVRQPVGLTRRRSESTRSLTLDPTNTQSSPVSSRVRPLAENH